MEVFEIQNVSHQADLIHFTWNDVGGVYRVYRDGDHFYEGTVPEFGDGDFKHAKIYNYTIERVVKGEVIDVIALQTSAFAEQLNTENPLQFLIMTTIVAKTQIALSWEKIQDVNVYEVYRNNVLLETVHTNQYIDRDFSLDESYAYAIHSHRSLSRSEEALSVSKSIAGRLVGLLNPLSSPKQTLMEVFKVTKLIAKPSQLLTPIIEKSPSTKANRWHFRYATFLEDEWIKNPNFLSRDRFFKGDGRGFDPEGVGYRTCVDIELAYDQDRMPLTFTKDIGQSISYKSSNKAHRKAVASSEGIQLERLDHSKGESGFHLTHAVGNPLVTAPEIDYEVHAVLRHDGRFDLTGFHDQAPHHEIYLSKGQEADWFPLHQGESKGLAWLTPITAWQYWRVSNFE